MSDETPRILCVGNDLALLNRGRDILQQYGYYIEVATPLGAIPVLRRGGDYDLLIVPVTLPESEQRLVMAAAQGTIPIYKLDRLIAPADLLAKVSDLLQCSSNHKGAAD